MEEIDDADDLGPVTEPVEPVAPPAPTRTPDQIAALASFRESMQSLPEDIDSQIAAYDADIRSPWRDLGGVLDPVPMPPPLTGLLSRQQIGEDEASDTLASPLSPLPSPTTQIEYRDRVVPDYSRPTWASSSTPTISSPPIVPSSPTPLMGAAFTPPATREPLADVPDLPSYRQLLNRQQSDAGLTPEPIAENNAPESILATAMAGPVSLPILPPDTDVPSPSPLPPIPPSVPLPTSPVGLPAAAAARPTFPDDLDLPTYRDLVAGVTGSDFHAREPIDATLSPPAMPSSIVPMMAERIDPPAMETRPVGHAFTPQTRTRTTTTEDASDSFEVPSYRELLQSSLPSPSWLDSDADDALSPPLTIPPSVAAGLMPPTLPMADSADVDKGQSTLPIPPSMPTRFPSTSMPQHLDYRAQLRSEFPALYGTTSTTTDRPELPGSTTPPPPLEFPSYHQMAGGIDADALPIPPSMTPAFDTMTMPPSSMPRFADGMTPPSASPSPPALEFPSYHQHMQALLGPDNTLFPPSPPSMSDFGARPFPQHDAEDADPLSSLLGSSGMVDGDAIRERLIEQSRRTAASDPLGGLGAGGGLADIMARSFGSAGGLAEGGSSKTDELLEKILKAIEGLGQGQGGQGSSYGASGTGPIQYSSSPLSPVDLGASESYPQSSPSVSVSILAGAGGRSGGRGREFGSRGASPQSLLGGGTGQPSPTTSRSNFFEPPKE